MADNIFDPERDPLDDMRSALEQARRERKHVLLELGGDWCVWCKRLHTFIESHPVLKHLRDTYYVVVKVYVDQERPVNVEFINRLPHFTGVPHVFVYTRYGHLLCSQDTEPLESGESYDYDLVYDFLQRWSDPRISPFKGLSVEKAKWLFEQYFRPASDDTTPSA